MISDRGSTQQHEEASFELSIGDLMAALLLIFVLLLAATLLNLQQEFDSKSQIAETYTELLKDLYEELYAEFADDLEQWGAEIDESTLAVRFQEPDILFLPDDDVLRPRFKEILNDFFPRYIRVLMRDKYRYHVTEMRIEGHVAKKPGTSYLEHMTFSQSRANSVLGYVMSLRQITDREEITGWLQARVLASGLAYSHPVDNGDGPVWGLSRRVEFRLKTDAEDQVRRMFEVGQEYRRQ